MLFRSLGPNVDLGFDVICGAAVSTRLDDRDRIGMVVDAGAKFVVIDAAHGWSKFQLDTIKFIKDNFSNYNIHVGIIGKAGRVGRTTIQKPYYERMFNSKIVVTCNPKDWEGDYRTWEALSSGALVMVDKMLTPIVNPLIDKEHIIFYDKNNLDDLKQKIIF